MSKWKIGLVGAAVVAAFAIPAVAMAQSGGAEDPPSTPTSTTTEPSEVTPETLDAKESLVVCEGIEVFDGPIKDLSADELAETNAENQELAAALRQAGIDVTMETDELGITYPVWADADDEAAWDVLDQFFDDKYGELDFDTDIELDPADVDFFNEEADALAAHLDAAGIASTVQTDELGVRWIEWDFNDEAANEAAEEFFSERYGDFEECQLPPEVVDDINAENRELAEALRDAGITVTMVAEPDGIVYPEWVEADDAAAEAVLDEFYGDCEHAEVFFDNLPDGLDELKSGVISGVVRVPAGADPSA